MKSGFLLVFLVLMTTLSCRNTAKEGSDCKYGSPRALFSPTQAGVQSHTFTAIKNEGTEQITFKDGLELTLLQSGCDHIRQEFQFTLAGNFEKEQAVFWVEKAAELLKRLSSMSPDYQTFSAWSQAIEGQKGQIKLAESTELGQNFYVKIDRILNIQNATLVLTLSDKP